MSETFIGLLLLLLKLLHKSIFPRREAVDQPRFQTELSLFLWNVPAWIRIFIYSRDLVLCYFDYVVVRLVS